MGGRGTSSGCRSGRTLKGYRTVGKISGIRAIRHNGGSGLPMKSFPSTNYYRVDKVGKVTQYRQYDKRGNAQTDIDWGHIHDRIPKGTPHIHDWKGTTRGDGRKLTPQEMKKYKSIIDKGMEAK